MQRFKEVGTGVAGAGSPILGSVISTIETIEPLVRFSSLVVGLIVGILAMIMYIKKLRGEDV